MKILNIISSPKLNTSLSFESKKKKHYFSNPTDKDGISQSQYWSELSIPYQKEYYIPSDNSVNMQAILATEPKRIDKKPLKSFENSDKLFKLDKYQQEAIEAYKEGKSVTVSAPTGTGKTLIAEYAIKDALDKKEKIIYLSPLKALGNEKYLKFCELFGRYDKEGNFLNSDNVGIMTGDVTINPNADVLVMTTEVYRNMLTSMTQQDADEVFNNYNGVIYDEFHYLKDKDRGSAWEESVMMTPHYMQQMMLSATAANASEIVEWEQEINPSKKTQLVCVDEKERHVPLEFYVYGKVHKKDKEIKLIPLYENSINFSTIQDNLTERKQEALKVLEEFYGKDIKTISKEVFKKKSRLSLKEFSEKIFSDCKNNPIKAKELGLNNPEKIRQIGLVLSSDTKLTKSSNYTFNYDGRQNISALAKTLKKTNKTPALFYIFSKKECKHTLDKVSRENGNLLTLKEQRRVYDIIKEAQDKGIYLGDDFEQDYMPKLLQGYALHHAGMLPAYKSLVEKLTREGLVKNVFATETLIAGIDMPIKTTVYLATKKMTSEGIQTISPSTFIQGAGRAGRRGKDLIGNVILYPSSKEEMDNFIELLNSKDTNIKSALKPSYNTLLQSRYLENPQQYFSKTLLYKQDKNPKYLLETIKAKNEILKKYGYIIEDIDGKIKPSSKGEIAKNIYGINPIFLTELITNPKYLEDFSPIELVGLCVMFADVKDPEPTSKLSPKLNDLKEKFNPAINLANEINREQEKYNINEPIKMSTSLILEIMEFAHSKSKDSIAIWGQVKDKLKYENKITHEGDLLRVVNSTIDILDTIYENTDNPYLKTKAQEAIDLLDKPPITDILRYELNID